MRSAMIQTLVTAALCSAAVGAQHALPSADAVPAELKAGNDHHVRKRYEHPHQTDLACVERVHRADDGQCAAIDERRQVTWLPGNQTTNHVATREAPSQPQCARNQISIERIDRRHVGNP